MSGPERLELIQALERERKSRVLCLVTGDRQNHETRIARDLLPLVIDHLRSFDHATQIDLLLYTPGGDTLVASSIVSSIREHCDKFSVLVPFRCVSAGTLIALGADYVLMGADGHLGPVDPSVGSPFNPVVQTPQGSRNVPVSVEDLQGFFALVRDGMGIRDDHALGQVLVALSGNVHPLALGAVWRAREQSKQLTERMLAFHLSDQARRSTIAEYLLTTHPSHQYTISRSEARGRIGTDLIPDVPVKIEQLMWKLYLEYQAMLSLTSPYQPTVELRGQGQVSGVFPRAALESVIDNELKAHVFRSKKELRSVQITQPNGLPVIGVQENILDEGWVTWPEEGIDGAG